MSNNPHGSASFIKEALLLLLLASGCHWIAAYEEPSSDIESVAARDGRVVDSAVDFAPPRDQKLVRDVALTDVALTDLALTDLALTDLALTDLALTDLALTDLALTDLAPRDLAPRDLAPKDLAPKDLAPRDLAPRDLAPRDLAPRDLAPRDLAPRDLAPRDTVLADLMPSEVGPSNDARQADATVAPQEPQYYWSQAFSSAEGAFPSAIAVEGRWLYVAGWFKGTLTIPGYGSLTSKGDRDMFVVAFDLDAGKFTWGKSFGSVGMDNLSDMDVKAGRLAIVGSCAQGVDFGGGLRTPTGGSSLALAVLDRANGNHIWSQVFTGSSPGAGIALDQRGAVYVTGRFSTTLDLGGGAIVDDWSG
jgi:hypothetical protein